MEQTAGTTVNVNPEDKISFVNDIEVMMFGLGDCQHPLRETAELMEKIVLEQIIFLLSQARQVADVREGTVLVPEDFLFLMRRNDCALKRFITYISVKDEKVPWNLILSGRSELDSAEIYGGIKKKSRTNHWEDGRKRYCLNYLKTFGFDEHDLMRINDTIKEERITRACNTSLNLSPAAYEQFHAARCKSFCNAKSYPARFIKWLRTRANCEEEITEPVSEILLYFAKETIACLIDMAFVIREDTKRMSFATDKRPITVDEIREVIRRHNVLQHDNLEPNTKELLPTVMKRLIAF